MSGESHISSVPPSTHRGEVTVSVVGDELRASPNEKTAAGHLIEGGVTTIASNQHDLDKVASECRRRACLVKALTMKMIGDFEKKDRPTTEKNPHDAQLQ